MPQLVPWVDGSVLGLGLDTREDSVSSGLGMDPDTLLGRARDHTRRSPVPPLKRDGDLFR